MGEQAAFGRVGGKEQRVSAEVWAPDVVRELSNLLAEVVLGRFGEVADRNQANEVLALHDRHVAAAALRHQPHDLQQRVVQRSIWEGQVGISRATLSDVAGQFA